MQEKAAIPISIGHLKTACSQCNLRELCLPYGLSDPELDRLDELVGTRRKIKRHSHLYRSGDSFEAIYAIRTGFLIVADNHRRAHTHAQRKQKH